MTDPRTIEALEAAVLILRNVKDEDDEGQIALTLCEHELVRLRSETEVDPYLQTR